MADSQLAQRLYSLRHVSTLILTHYGRKTGKPYQVKIWFTVESGAIYLTTLNADRQWVRNVKSHPEVKLNIGGQEFSGEVQSLTEPAEFAHAMDLTTRKYAIARVFSWLAKPLMGLFPDRRGAFRVALSS